MQTVLNTSPDRQHPSGLLISALSVEALRDFITRGAAAELVAYMAALLGLGRAPVTLRPVDPDDTSRCPLDSGCETCGAVDDLALLTAPVMSGGITCITLCGSCADACDLPTSWTRAGSVEKVYAHARHLGISGTHLAVVVLEQNRMTA